MHPTNDAIPNTINNTDDNTIYKTDETKLTHTSATNTNQTSEKKANKSTRKYAHNAPTTEATKSVAQIKAACHLSASQAKRYTDPSTLPLSTEAFITHSQADGLTQVDTDIGFGQQRALGAIDTALGIQANGYHIFATGENGLGKRTLITKKLTQYAKHRPTPNDWIYVHNFTNPRQPIALPMPAGGAKKLAQQMQDLWQSAKKRLNQRFRSDYYQNQIEAIKNAAHAQEMQAYQTLEAEGRQYDLTLTFRPLDNKAIFVKTTEQINEQQSDKQDNKDNQQQIDFVNKDSTYLADNHPDFVPKNHMHKRLNSLTIALEQVEDAANHDIDMLHQELAQRTLAPLFAQLKQQLCDHYQALNQSKALNQPNQTQPHVSLSDAQPSSLSDNTVNSAHNANLDTTDTTANADILLTDVFAHLDNIYHDMVANVTHIINEDDEQFVSGALQLIPSRYGIHVLVTHSANTGAPVIFEDLPTHLNLLGHVEQVTHMGTVSSDVSMIRAGSLHRANGGYLILEASHLLEHPYAWQGLKRALQSKQLKLSSLEQMLTLTGSLSLAPAPIALDIKVILLGELDLYDELLQLEPEFDAVFFYFFHFRAILGPCE